MLKLGNKNISKLYLGDKAISKAYLGEKLVYQANKPIFLEYVEFDGNSWIDTGINKQSCTIECTVKLESTGYRQFLGGWSHIGGYYIAVDTSNRFELGSSAIVTGSNATELSNIVAEHTETEMILTVNGNYAKRTKQVQTEPDKNYWLGNINSTSYSAPIKGQVYGHKFISPDGVLIQDLRPCIDPKGTVCMYDMVTKKYFYNQGTGTLTAGNVIKFVDYIEFDGASYIDTLFKPNPHTTRTVLDCMLLDNTSSGGQGVFGSRPTSVSSINSMNIWFNTSDAPKKLRLDCTGNYQTTNTDIVDITQRLLIDCLDNNATVNGVTYSANVDKSNTTYLDYSMYLGNFNNVGKPYTKGCKMNVYGFTIYDNGVLIQDLKPCLVNSEACFYDMVTGNLFYNQGTGTLKASPRFVESIVSDGNSYIDTGIVLGINHKVSVKTKVPSTSSTAIQLFGNYSDSAGYFTCNVANSIGAISRFDGATYTGNISRSDGNFHTYSLDKNGILIDSDAILNWNKTPTDFQQSDSFYLFRARGSSSVTPNGTQISRLRVWGNDILIQDLRPYVDENGTACFKDLVTDKLFYNQGTGTLSYTE